MEKHAMDATQLWMLIVSQAFVWASLGFAVYWVKKCCSLAPGKRWRISGIMAWLMIGVVMAAANTIVIAVGCPPLPVMRITVWIDRVALLIGYIVIAYTYKQVAKFYGSVGHDA